MAQPNPTDPKQQEAHAVAVREKGIRDRTLPVVQSWPVDEEGKPMTVIVAMASDLVPTVPFGNVTIQSTIMRPAKVGEEISDADLAVDIVNARKVQKAAEYVVGTERRVLQWALDPATRVTHPTTAAAFTGEGEQLGQNPGNVGAEPSGEQPSASPSATPAPAGDGAAQVG